MNLVDKLRCPECKSIMTYVRIRKKELVCRSCGNVSKIKNQENQRNSEELIEDA